MTASKGLRGRRSDSGVVRPTDRDVGVLRWLGEQYGAPLGVVANLYGVADPRRNVRRLERAGFASRQQSPTGVWLVPTRRGLRYCGLEYEAWELVGWKAAHVAAVGRLRLLLEHQYRGCGWESERACRARWHGSGARVRIPDGILEVEGHRVGCEVELHRKAAHRYPGILADLDPALTDCWWFVRGADQGWLEGVLAGVPCAIPQRVLPLTGELAIVLGVRS